MYEVFVHHSFLTSSSSSPYIYVTKTWSAHQYQRDPMSMPVKRPVHGRSLPGASAGRNMCMKFSWETSLYTHDQNSKLDGVSLTWPNPNLNREAWYVVAVHLVKRREFWISFSLAVSRHQTVVTTDSAKDKLELSRKSIGLILHFWPDHSSDHENKSPKDHQNRLCKICPDYGGKAWSKIFARVLHKKLHIWTLIGGFVLTSSNCEDASNCKKNQDCQVQSTFTWYITHVTVVTKNGLKLCFTFETKSQLDIKCSREKIRLRTSCISFLWNGMKYKLKPTDILVKI